LLFVIQSWEAWYIGWDKKDNTRSLTSQILQMLFFRNDLLLIKLDTIYESFSVKIKHFVKAK